MAALHCVMLFCRAYCPGHWYILCSTLKSLNDSMDRANTSAGRFKIRYLYVVRTLLFHRAFDATIDSCYYRPLLSDDAMFQIDVCIETFAGELFCLFFISYYLIWHRQISNYRAVCFGALASQLDT